jgi:hypothetical protein
MADFFTSLLRVVFELVFEITLYATGRSLLPAISFGRIKVAPSRAPTARGRVLPSRSSGEIVAGEGWCKFVGFVFWAGAILLLVDFLRSGS